MNNNGCKEDFKLEIQKAVVLPKCKKCACLKITLEALIPLVNSSSDENIRSLAEDIKLWLNELQPIEYDCLGCDPCYPAEAMKIFNRLKA